MYHPHCGHARLWPHIKFCYVSGMTRADAIAALLRRADELRASGVVHVTLFGSVARDRAGPDSDVDLIVETSPDKPITSTSSSARRNT